MSVYRDFMKRARVCGLLLVAVLVGLYGMTMAIEPITGDPAEYTLVSHVLGVAHPPGYAFMTLVGKLFQTVIPVGTVVWRTHLVAVTAGILASLFVYGTIKAFKPDGWHGVVAGLFGGLSVGTAVNHWQHSIHANPHIITATFIAFNLFVLTRWYIGQDGERDDGWLYAFCVAAGLGVTHHPLTAFALPACALFVLVVEPRILLRWKTLLIGTAFVALGLLPWFYFPLRAPHLGGTLFNDVSNANTVDGFLDIVLARQLRQNLDNLSYFGWADQLRRFVVFALLLRLQFTLPVIGLAVFGGWKLGASEKRPLLLLYLGVFGSLYAFVINTVQDVMAYLLAPFLIVGVLAGIGVGFLPQRHRGSGVFIFLAFVCGVGWNLLQNLPVISLRDEQESREYVELVHETFDGTAANATLISDWERATVLWVHQFVEGGTFDAADVVPLKVDPGKWREMVCAHIGDGAVYLNRYQQSVKGFAEGKPCAEFNFRLRTRGALTEVALPGETAVPPELTRVDLAGDGVGLLGYGIDREGAAGEQLQLTVAMRVPEATGNIYFPILTVGDVTFSFTDDSHHLSNSWYPNEVIVAGYQFVLPHRLEAGKYPVSLTIHERIGDRPTGIALDLGEITISAAERIPETEHLLVNFQHRVGLEKVVAWEGGRHHAPWGEPIVVDSGETIDLYLHWRVLDYAESPYKLFLHLSNPATFQPVRAYDDIPMGGAMPSHLWFPKWLPEQRMVDPYRITTAGVPAGEYVIVAGMTDFFTMQRLPIYAESGDLNGDQKVLGRVIVK